jgi:hypothetical protein
VLEGPDRGECEPPKSDYAFSMPKLRARPTKTVQLKLANLLDFHGFRRVLLVRVSPGIALITRRFRQPDSTPESSRVSVPKLPVMRASDPESDMEPHCRKPQKWQRRLTARLAPLAVSTSHRPVEEWTAEFPSASTSA